MRIRNQSNDKIVDVYLKVTYEDRTIYLIKSLLRTDSYIADEIRKRGKRFKILYDRGIKLPVAKAGDVYDGYHWVELGSRWTEILPENNLDAASFLKRW